MNFTLTLNGYPPSGDSYSENVTPPTLPLKTAAWSLDAESVCGETASWEIEMILL